MSGFKKFKEELPHIEKFYSLMTNKKSSDNKYEHVLKVLKVWNTFQIKTMKDYHDFYL